MSRSLTEDIDRIEGVLNRLKDDLATRHIPVQVITTDEERERPLRMGAMGVLSKPIVSQEPLDEMKLIASKCGEFTGLASSRMISPVRASAR